MKNTNDKKYSQTIEKKNKHVKVLEPQIPLRKKDKENGWFYSSHIDKNDNNKDGLLFRYAKKEAVVCDIYTHIKFDDAFILVYRRAKDNRVIEKKYFYDSKYMLTAPIKDDEFERFIKFSLDAYYPNDYGVFDNDELYLVENYELVKDKVIIYQLKKMVNIFYPDDEIILDMYVLFTFEDKKQVMKFYNGYDEILKSPYGEYLLFRFCYTFMKLFNLDNEKM